MPVSARKPGIDDSSGTENQTVPRAVVAVGAERLRGEVVAVSRRREGLVRGGVAEPCATLSAVELVPAVAAFRVACRLEEALRGRDRRPRVVRADAGVRQADGQEGDDGHGGDHERDPDDAHLCPPRCGVPSEMVGAADLLREPGRLRSFRQPPRSARPVHRAPTEEHPPP